MVVSCSLGGDHRESLCSPSTRTSGKPTAKAATLLVYFLCPFREGPFVHTRSAEITGLLKAWANGDKAALDELAEHVYPEFRRMARRYVRNEGHGNTLQATALIHEVYLRLIEVTNVEFDARSFLRWRRR